MTDIIEERSQVRQLLSRRQAEATYAHYSWVDEDAMLDQWRDFLRTARSPRVEDGTRRRTS